MTATFGPSPLTTYSYQPTRLAFFSAAEPTAGWAARMMPVRAKPTIGGASGSVGCMCWVVKPAAVRKPRASSSALQIVGVSTARKASNSFVWAVLSMSPPVSERSHVVGRERLNSTGTENISR